MTAPPPDPGVYISPAQTYQEVRGLSQAVGRIEGKLDQALRENADLRGDVQDHEDRLRRLEAAPKTTDLAPRVQEVEKLVWRAAGAAGVVGAAAGIFVPLLFR